MDGVNWVLIDLPVKIKLSPRAVLTAVRKRQKPCKTESGLSQALLYPRVSCH